MLLSDDQLKTILVSTKLLDEKGLSSVVEFAKNSNTTLADALIQRDILSDENLGMNKPD